MVKGQHQVVWTRRAQQHMKQAHEYISKESPQNAIKVLTDIIASLDKASANPEFYNPDKYKKDNDGSYRAFEKHYYRIAYRFSQNIKSVERSPHKHGAEEVLIICANLAPSRLRG